MNADFIQALEDIEKEKGISKEYMLVTIEAALAAAYKRGNTKRESLDCRTVHTGPVGSKRWTDREDL